MSKQDIRQDNTQVTAEEMSTSGSIRDRIQQIPADEEFIIYIAIGGDPYVDEQD